ncbi:MAG: hypothetical protein ACQESR_19190 [Planctomycetota bacterium]
MPDDFIFIATLGQNDVHVVYRPAGGAPRRHPLRKDCVRAFHQDCLDGRISYRVTPLAETATLLPRNREEMEYVRDSALISAETFGGQGQVEVSLAPDLELCAPLLAGAWAQIEEKIRRGELGRARHVLLLNTRRDDVDEQGRPREGGEPIAAGQIVRPAVAGAFGLADDAVEECFFLTAGDLYDIDVRNQRHLRSDAARRIDDRVRQLSRGAHGVRGLISDIGGFPETKAVLTASVHYRFDGRLEFIRPVERDRAMSQRGTVVIPAGESLNTRHQIVRLIRRGCFDAAAELARHPLGDEALQAEPWRRSVTAVARFLRASQLTPCGGQVHKELCALQRQPRSVVVLFRIEAALRRGDLENAICDTVTFAELALLELLERHLSQANVTCIDWDELQIVRDNCLPEFQAQNPDQRYWLEGFKGCQTMSSWLPEDAQRAWLSVSKVVRRRAVNRARNAATHAHASRQRIAAADRCLRDLQLWAEQQDWKTILGAPALRDLLAALEISDVRERYQRLVDALRRDIDELIEPVEQPD